MTGDATTMPQLDEMYDAFSVSRRRYTLWTLARIDSNCFDVNDLADEITADEQDIKPDQAAGDSYRSVYGTLNQSHLPKLDELGFVEYDPDRKTVAPGPLFEEALFVLKLNQVTYGYLNMALDSRKVSPTLIR